MNNLFQIIVPIFNEEETLEQILLYAKENDYLKHIVFVDDASNDSSLEILRKWAKQEKIRAISLNKNRQKEGAIRIVLELLERKDLLPPYTILLDADAFINPTVAVEVFETRIERAIAHMKQYGLSGLAFQIDAISNTKNNIFSCGAFADYAAMQFDQWLVGKQQKLWVINGPGGLFQTEHLLQILRSIVPDFETGDLLITVELMKQHRPIEFYPEISVSTFVPTTLHEYFNQRRRWERGTTKVLWNDRKFYYNLFPRFSLLALSTLIHLSLYVGLTALLIMLLSGVIPIDDALRVILVTMAVWFVVSLLKGGWLTSRRSRFPFPKYCLCAVGNGLLWIFVTTPARITGCLEGVIQLFSKPNRKISNLSLDAEDFHWLPLD